MSLPKKIPYGPVVLVCDNAPLTASSSGQQANWSHAFQVALEKRGFVDFQVWSYDQFRTASPQGYPPGVIFVGPAHKQGMTANELETLRQFNCPVIIEAAALDTQAQMDLCLSCDHSAAKPDQLHFSPEEPALKQQLEDFAPLLPNYPEIPLPSGAVKTRYEVPARSTLKIKETDTNLMRSARMLLQLAFSLCRKIQSETLPFPNQKISALAAFALACVSRKLPNDSNRDYVRQQASDLLNKLINNVATKQLCTAAAEVLKGKPSSELKWASIQKQLGTPVEDLSHQTPENPYTRVTDWALKGIYEYANGNPACLEETISKLVLHRLDKAMLSFFTVEQASGQKQYANHPAVLLALSLIDLPIADALPKELQLRDFGISQDTADLWSQPPKPYTATPQASDKVFAFFESGMKKPAIWQKGEFTILGFPALAMVGYAHTLPPLSAPFFETDALAALLLEEALFTIVVERLRISETIVLQVMPWPDNKTPVIIRHDVDRIPKAEQFQKLATFYQDNAIRCSWYWLADRTHAPWISDLSESGHEIGLHAISGPTKTNELEALEALSATPVAGECFHGSGAEYHRGSLSILAAAQAGLNYTELHPEIYGYPYKSFPILNEQGHLIYERRLVHITFTTTTDAAAGQSRKTDVTDNEELFKLWAQKGYYTCILNHPDQNFLSLERLIEDAKRMNLTFTTADHLARWWDATHTQSCIRVCSADSALEVSVPPASGKIGLHFLGSMAGKLICTSPDITVSKDNDSEMPGQIVHINANAYRTVSFTMPPKTDM